MEERKITTRLLEAEDFDAIVRIDEKVLNASRPDYYELKFDQYFTSRDYLPTSLVAEDEDGNMVGFIMGKLYMGEYGIFQEEASLDTIGVDPDYQNRGVGEKLMNELIDHLRELGVKKVNTLVGWSDTKLIHFFSANKFSPSKTIYLERSL